MRIIALLSSLGLLVAGSVQAQVYKVTTEQSDSFSVELVKLMNCAVERFKDCKGDLIRSTSLMGDDYKLTIPFPGSVMGIVRYRDSDKNAYLEFRGFADKKSRLQGVKGLVAKIKKALGDQLYDPHDSTEREEIYFYGLSVKDRNGYFSMNMEIFSGSSPADIYLLGPEKEEENKPGKDFVLLKVYGGIPAYQYYIPAVTPPDKKLDTALGLLLKAAGSDFDSMPAKPGDALLQKRKSTDTIQLNGMDVLMNYRGGNYSANLLFPAAADSAAFNRQWMYFQQALQAALGSRYVYHLFGLDERPYVVYYPKDYSDNKPRVYLELEKEYNDHYFINIKIESSYSHPAKRGVGF